MRKPNEKTETIYTLFMNAIKACAYRAGSFQAFYMAWWLREETGFPTSEINYHLGKKVKEGLLLKKSHMYGSSYSPVTYEGYERQGDYFVKIKTETP